MANRGFEGLSLSKKKQKKGKRSRANQFYRRTSTVRDPERKMVVFTASLVHDSTRRGNELNDPRLRLRRLQVSRRRK